MPSLLMGFAVADTLRLEDADVVDLGGIRAARGTEMYLPLLLSLMQVIGSGDFNINVGRA